MSKENIKISKEELEAKKALYRKILDDNYYFFWSLKKRFEKEEHQVPKKAFKYSKSVGLVLVYEILCHYVNDRRLMFRKYYI